MSTSNASGPSVLRREPSPERGKSQMMKKIYDEIGLATKLADTERAYICNFDLRRIWADTRRLETVLQPDHFSQAELEYIQEHLMMILSTFIYIDAVKCLSTFRNRFFDHTSGQARFTDENFPFEKNELGFFGGSEGASQQQFYENQFRFRPVVIEIDGRSTPLTIKNPKQRLPFESHQEGVGAGGYGQVDCVGISPRCIRLADGSVFEKVYLVACKKIELPEDFDKERENLQILKESLTTHSRIMLHFTTIEHGPNRYILLPYAPYGDLEIFLHCGVDAFGRKKYDFNNRFNKVGDNDITPHLLAQCWSLGNALDWLHSGIKIENSSSTVFCVHMDLKPANILIQHDDKSSVGKWVISDFGISVMEDQKEKEDAEYGSIGDYISRVTVNTRPKRIEGTYQAPEVKLSEGTLSQRSHLTPDQRGIGRKSDIWSFGCILSEVLAFSLGKDTLVKEFQLARKRNARDDYFYSKRTDRLAAADVPKEYQVRPTVLSWLDSLCKRAASPQRWVDCYVGTVRKILIVDTTERPDATELSKLVRHLKDHVRDSRGSATVKCSILDPEAEEVVPTAPTRDSTSSPFPFSFRTPPPIPREDATPALPKRENEPNPSVLRSSTLVSRKPIINARSSNTGSGNNAIPTPQVFRSDTFNQELIHDNGEASVSCENKVFTGVNNQKIHRSIANNLPPISETISSSTHDSDVNPRPGPHPVQENDSDPGGTSSSGAPTNPSLFTSFMKPTHAHGVMIDPAVNMHPATSTCVHLPKVKGSNLKITCMALANWTSGARLACLSKSSVYIYTLSAEGMAVIPEAEVPLAEHNGWSGVTVAGNFLAAWGFSSTKLLHFCDIREPQNSLRFSLHDIAMLSRVAVSHQGVAALVCGGKIIITTLDPQEEPITLSGLPDQNFTDAAFNETGNILYAWAYGQIDSLYSWRWQDHVMSAGTESESNYETVMDKRGKPYLTRVIPYNTYQGCIIAKPDKRLFPAQIHSSIRGTRKTLSHNNEISLFNLQAVCVFNDHSVITVEKEMLQRHSRLKEYQIDYKSTHLLRKPAVEICKLNSSTDSSSQVLAVKKDETIVIIICNTNATVEFIKVVPR